MAKSKKSTDNIPSLPSAHITSLSEAISDAKKVMKANKLPFATIWKTGESYGFNFEKREVGYETNQYGVKRIVVAVIDSEEDKDVLGDGMLINSSESIANDIKIMQSVLKSDYLTPEAKKILKDAIDKAQRILDSATRQAKMVTDNAIKRSKKISKTPPPSKTPSIKKPQKSLLKKAINSNTPKGEMDADALLTSFREKSKLRKRKPNK
jgi:cell division septum initiation protein DivIVA